MTKSQSSNSRFVVGHPSRWKWALPAVILLLATALRLCCLGNVPPGLTHDEANNVHDAVSILHGARPFYFPVAQGKEPLYSYSVALMMALVGPTPVAMRLTSAFWGLLLVAVTYTWTQRAFGRSTALWTTLGLTLSFWGVSTSRVGLRAIVLPVLFTAALLASHIVDRESPRMCVSPHARPGLPFLRGLPSPAIAGLLLGLSLYTYLAARVMPATILLFGLYLSLVAQNRWRRCWRTWLVMLIVAAVVALPLVLYLQAHPSAEIRVGQLDRPLRALVSGDPMPLLDNVFQTFYAFSFRGDGFIPYNIPGRPFFDPLMSVLFYVGVGIALWRWRDPGHAFALLWLAVGFFPAMATGVEAVHLRAIGAQPILYLFPALTLESLRSVRVLRMRLSWLVGVCAFAMVTCFTVRDYFVRWPNDPDVRVHYHVDLTAISDTLREGDNDRPVAISALYPHQYHDPRIPEAMLVDDSPPLSWFDGRQAVLLPQAPAFDLIVPAAVPIDNAIWDLIKPNLTLHKRVSLRSDDLNPTFDVYRWSAVDPSTALRSALGASHQSANVGQQLVFQGYRIENWTGDPGSTFTLLTLWQILTPLSDDRDAVLFTQLLDGEHHVIAQQDRLGAPSWGWQPGDVFLQIHYLSLPPNPPQGEYTLIAGVYTVPDRIDAVLAGHEPDPTMSRLPIREQDKPTSDHLVLGTLEVK